MRDETPATEPHTTNRRGLLALIGAGGAAAVAALFSRRNGAEAHGTYQWNDDTADPVGHFTNGSTGDGVRGTSSTGDGVVGEGHFDTGVKGISDYGYGVEGSSIEGYGVLGQSSSLLAGVRGTNANTDGVRGDGHTGVRGIGTSTGVRGDGPIGVRGVGTVGGVVGQATSSSGVGVYGLATSGRFGVRGHGSGTGKIGVLASAYSGALALRASGRTQFTNAGRTYISAGQSSRTVTGKIVPPSALIFATMRSNPGSADVKWVRRASNTSFTIYLTQAASHKLYVDYFITN